jgi:hypothetical protein
MRHGLSNLLEAILNPVEAPMTSTDLLETILNPAEAAMTSMDLLEGIIIRAQQDLYFDFGL